jgi:hypothetical protein
MHRPHAFLCTKGEAGSLSQAHDRCICGTQGHETVQGNSSPVAVTPHGATSMRDCSENLPARIWP